MNRLARALLGSIALLAVIASPALAGHAHVMAIGNGQCVLLTANGGEADVTLPLAVFEHNPNVDIAPVPDRRHPLHVLVHQGVPGERHPLAVAGTPAAAALCPAGIANG